jgi:hypothetical protein
MTPSGLVSVVSFTTAPTVRLLSLLNLNAVVLYCPSILLPHENRTPAPVDNDSIFEPDSKGQTIGYLSLWLSHMLQDHNLSQSMPQWNGQNATIAVNIRLTVNFSQPPVNRSFGRMAAFITTGPTLKNGIP